MKKIDESEQWLLDGKCHICRREKYCSKSCTKCKQREQYEIRGLVGFAMVRLLSEK